MVNAFWLVSDRVVRLIVNFFVGLLIARHLGPDGFGVLNYGQVMLMLLTPLATFGLPDITVRELARRQVPADRVMATALAVRLTCALAALLVLATIAFVGRGGNPTAAFVILAYGVSLIPQSFDVLESRYQAENMLGLLSTARMVNTVLFAGCRLVALYLSASVVWFAAFQSVELAFFVVFTLLDTKRRGWHLRVRDIDRALGVRLLKQSAPLMIRLVTIGIYMRIDQVFIQHYMGDTALGVYSASTRIAELWYFVPLAIVTGAAPTLTVRFDQSIEEYEIELLRLMRIMVLMSVPLAAVISFGAGPIVHILFGNRYAAAVPVLAIHAWAGVFVAVGVAASPWFVNTGQLRYGLYQAVAGAIVSIGMNIVLIPLFGLRGAAFSLVFSYAISAIGMNGLFPQTRSLLRLQLRAFLLR